MTRKDLEYRLGKYVVPAFRPLWWFITVALVNGTCVLLWAIVVMFILLTS